MDRSSIARRKWEEKIVGDGKVKFYILHSKRARSFVFNGKKEPFTMALGEKQKVKRIKAFCSQDEVLCRLALGKSPSNPAGRITERLSMEEHKKRGNKEEGKRNTLSLAMLRTRVATFLVSGVMCEFNVGLQLFALAFFTILAPVCHYSLN